MAPPQVLASQHLPLPVCLGPSGQWVSTLAVRYNHQGAVENYQRLRLALRGSDLIGLQWGLGMRILRSSHGRLSQEKMNRKPSK